MTLPFREVNERLTGEQAAREVGLKAARERRKFACPSCDSSDGLHGYPKPGAGSYCFACGTSFSAVDLAVAAWGLTPADACRRLADRLGIAYDGPCAPPMTTAVPDPTPEPDEPAPDPTPEPTNRLRAEALGVLVASMTLGPMGRDYLQSRGLDPDHASALGLRSWESDKEARSLLAHVATACGPGALEAAGFGTAGRVWLPWHGRVPALLLPTFEREGTAVHSVRFRRMDAGAGKRYMAPIGRGARVPWRSEAFDSPDPLELVIAEGELDGLALVQAGYESVALGGATPASALLAYVVEAAERCETLALWTDSDTAGNGAVDRLVNALVRRYGGAWTRAHVRRWRSRVDACEMARQGALR